MTQEFTLGVEEEFQIIDPETRELAAQIEQMKAARTALEDIELQGELHESCVEVATPVCKDVHEIREQVIYNRRLASTLAERIGMRIGAASTHPFAKWQEQKINPSERYLELVNDFQDIARANLIFGMHVHVGVPDKQEAIRIFNSVRYFLPHLLALSTSSPFFEARKTGMKSMRSLIFERLPRTGIPERFELYEDFLHFQRVLIDTSCIDNGSRIWWDIRPHPAYSTLEFRICDIPTRVDHVVSITAVVQALVAKLAKLHRQNMAWQIHRTALIRENKWRALRYGIEGRLIDFGKVKEIPFFVLINELLEFIDDVVDDLGSRDEVEGIHDILRDGTSADGQLRVFEESGGDLHAVVDYIIEETMYGIGNDISLPATA